MGKRYCIELFNIKNEEGIGPPHFCSSLISGKCVVTNSGVYFGFNGFVVELRTGVSDPSAEFTSKEINIVNNEVIETGDNYTLITTFPSSDVVSQTLTYNGKTYTKNTLLEDNKITEVVS